MNPCLSRNSRSRPQLVLNSQGSACLSLPNPEIKGVSHRAPLHRDEFEELREGHSCASASASLVVPLDSSLLTTVAFPGSRNSQSTEILPQGLCPCCSVWNTLFPDSSGVSLTTPDLCSGISFPDAVKLPLSWPLFHSSHLCYHTLTD